jgi:SH3 domain protein
MKKVLCLLLLVVSLFLVSFPALAQKGYIRDMVIVNLRTAPFSNAQSVKLLRTGDSMNILEERDAFMRIRTPEGVEGWVSAQYITEVPPARIRLVALQNQNSNLKRNVDELKAKVKNDRTQFLETKERFDAEGVNKSSVLSQVRGEANALAAELDGLKKEHETLAKKSANAIKTSEELDLLTQENKELVAKYEDLASRVSDLTKMTSIKWFLVGAGVLILGWFIGVGTGSKRRSKNFM